MCHFPCNFCTVSVFDMRFKMKSVVMDVRICEYTGHLGCLACRLHVLSDADERSTLKSRTDTV